MMVTEKIPNTLHISAQQILERAQRALEADDVSINRHDYRRNYQRHVVLTVSFTAPNGQYLPGAMIVTGDGVLDARRRLARRLNCVQLIPRDRLEDMAREEVQAMKDHELIELLGLVGHQIVY